MVSLGKMRNGNQTETEGTKMSNWKLNGVSQDGPGSCEVCGTRIKYHCYIENTETGEERIVGRECAGHHLSRKIKGEIGWLKSEEKVAAYLKRWSDRYDREVLAGYVRRLHVYLADRHNMTPLEFVNYCLR